jgi:hypothetical protein
MRRRLGWMVVTWAVLLVLWSAAPALAHHKSGHAQGGGSAAAGDHDGDADSDRGTSYTEDNDTNDGGTPNNVVDEGDNRHPSGKDKSVEHGNSGNQGKSESDPDDDGRGPDRSNGGPDKPNGSGGDDLADQDGNNGCGNDDDFEDDNEGWCGKNKPLPEEKPDDEVDADVLQKETDRVGVVLPGLEDRVLGNELTRPKVSVGADSQVAPLASRQETGSSGSALPFTGAGLAGLITIGLALMGAGGIATRVSRS